MYVCMCVLMCVHMSMCVDVCAHMYVCVCVCEGTHMHMQVYVGHFPRSMNTEVIFLCAAKSPP